MPQTPAHSGSATIADVVRQAASRLAGPDARRETELLLEHVLDVDRAWLFAHANEPIEAQIKARLDELIERRKQGEPVAYILGRAGFWTLDLIVGPATLVPRPETELLVEVALEYLPADQDRCVADLGTGSGAIALALGRERPQARILATDASEAALTIARGNAERNAVANVEFRCGSWFEPVQGMRFHLIASNPPYVADDDPHLQQGDLRFEPDMALSCGPDGMDAIRQIIVGAGPYLHRDGWLILEHGLDQGAAVRELLQAAGFAQVQTRRDLEDRDRISLGLWSGRSHTGP